MFKKYLTLAISTTSFIFLFGLSANALDMKVYYEDSDSFPFSMKNVHRRKSRHFQFDNFSLAWIREHKEVSNGYGSFR